MVLLAGAVATLALQFAPVATEVLEVSYLVALIGAAVVALAVSRRRPAADRWGWTMIAVGLAMSAMGDLVYQWYVWADVEALGASWADPWWLLSYLFTGLGAARVLRPTGERVAFDLDAFLDSAALALVTGFALWQLYLAELMDDQTVELPTRLVNAAYPVVDAILLLLLVRSLRTGVRGAAARLLCVGVACWLVSDLAYLVASDVDLSRFEPLMSAGWILGSVLLAAAAWITAGPGPTAPAPDPSESISPGRIAWTVLPIFVPSTVNAIAHQIGREPDPVVLLLETVLLLGLILVRAVRLVGARDHAQGHAARRERFFETLAASSSDAVLVVDGTGRILHDSPLLPELLGRPVAGSVGLELVEVIDPTDRESLTDAVAKAVLVPDEIHHAETELAGEAAAGRSISARVVNRFDDPAVRGLIVTLHDITARRAAADELRRQAFQDSLTGLANRALFRDRLEHAMARQARSGLDPAVLFLDIDGFKKVNDSMGHEAGDAVLVALAERIQRSVRSDDTVARLGGDEFAILIEESVDPAGDAAAAAERVIGELAAPVQVGDRLVTLSASVGIEVGGPLLDASAVLRNADIAMYRAKAQGRGQWVIFDPSMRNTALAHLELETDLAQAIARDELFLTYQPVVDLATGALTGFEALLRWEHPERGLLGPDLFIPVAEETGLIVEIGAWVLETACATAARWQREHPRARPLTMAVNISGVQLARPDLTDHIVAALDRSGMRPVDLVLEMTETVLVVDPVAAGARLEALRALGLRVAIDDFGTGYSSFSYLRQFPVDILKIDRTFVDDISPDLAVGLPALVRTLLDLARTLDLEVVAEGIEREGQFEQLRGSCQLGQGYLFARPLRVADADALVAGATLLGGLAVLADVRT